MTGQQRKSQIKALLTTSDQPISANNFAKKFNVSRQTIVGDIALLRAQGELITATPRGYEYQLDHLQEAIIACQHTSDDIEHELTIMVETKVLVRDVIVDHPVYGQLKGELAIQTSGDAHQFLAKLKQSDSYPLSTLTHGIHLHTIAYQDAAQLAELQNKLNQAGFLFNN